jgi:hypothetical protein
MKTLLRSFLRIFVGLPIFLALALPADFSLAAVDTTFGAGSLIIPMDGSTYQSSTDGGIYVAYGFVYQLLNRTNADGTPNPIPVYWIINPKKTSVTGTDLTISSTTVDPVAQQVTAKGNVNIGGVGKVINYSGGPFVVDYHYAAAAQAIWTNGFQNVNLHIAKIPFTASVQRQLYGSPPKIALMNSSESRTGMATSVLQAYLRIAGIVNPATDVNGKPCDTVPVSGTGCIYDVLTPNEVGGIKTLAGTPLNGKSLLFDYTCAGCATNPKPQYKMVWVPHWTGNTNKLGQYVSSNPAVGTMPSTAVDGDDATMAIRDFIKSGGSLFAECAGIETFEASQYGRFLTKYGIGENGGSMDSDYMYYNQTTLDSPFAQVGSFSFDPTGGHLHNWRPFQTGDSSMVNPPKAMAFDPSATNQKSTYTQSNTGYDTAVSVFTYDDPPPPTAGTVPPPALHNYVNGDAAYDQWHYFIGGNMDGDPSNGYVVYLGGHSYVSCGSTGTSNNPDHEMRFTWSSSLNGITGLTMTVVFVQGKTTTTLTQSGITILNLTTKSKSAGPFTLDLSGASFDINGKTLSNVHFVNNDANNPITVTSFKGTWDATVGGTLTDIYDVTEDRNPERVPANNYTSGTSITLTGLTLDPGSFASGCTTRSGGAVRYVLNTLFQLNAVSPTEFVRSTPVVYQDFLYQGSFEYPSFAGHLRKFQVNADLGNNLKGLKLDTGFGTGGDTAPLLTSNVVWTDRGGGADLSKPNKIIEANELTGRNIWASTEAGLETPATVLKDNTLLQQFKFENAALFQSRMSAIAALTLSQTQTVISNRYGMRYDQNLLTWVVQGDVMGGMEHAAPVVIGPSTLTSATRPTMVYAGALDGMIHAFQAGTNTATSASNPGEISGAGKEVWSFIPSSQLPRLQYNRDPNAISTYPAVDASLAYAEVPNASGQYVTVLLATMGVGGNSLVALDVTNPTTGTPAKPKVLWETSGYECHTDPVSHNQVCSVIMGNGSKVAIGRVMNKSGQHEYRAYVTTALQAKQTCLDPKTGKAKTDGSLCGGIQVFVFDLFTGAQKWRFQRIYTNGVNDIPGSLALVDVDQNGDEDYVLIGDMEGNLWLLPTVPDYDKDNAEDTVIKTDYTLALNASVSGSLGVISGVVPLYAPTRDEVKCDAGRTPSTNSTQPCYVDKQDQPVGISATVVTKGGRTTIVWGTGGAQWSSDTAYYAIYALDITSVNVYALLDANGVLQGTTLTYKFVLDQGEKVFGAVTYSQGSLYVATAFGNVDGVSPKDDVALTNQGNIRGISISDSKTNWKYAANGKFRGSVFVSKGELYATTLDGKIIDLGNGTFTSSSALKWYKPKNWREIFNLITNQ